MKTSIDLLNNDLTPLFNGLRDEVENAAAKKQI
jgi:hypothetical protein